MSEHPNLLKSVLIFTNPKGQHNSSLAYQKMDEVQHQTSIYVATENIPAGVAITDARWAKKLDNSTAYQAEQERQTAEGEREQAEDARETAEGLREQGEIDRNNAYSQAESARDGLYATAESARDGLFEGAQQDRTSAYGLREDQRDDAYDAAELARGGLYEAAESARDGLYENAEASREQAFEAAEIERNQTLAEGIEAGRLNYKGPYNPSTLYSFNNWVTDSGSSYAYINPTPSTGVSLADTSHWQQIASRGMTGPSAYDAAVAGEYTGTEAEFNAANAGLPAAVEGANDAAETANEAAENAETAAYRSMLWRKTASGNPVSVYPVPESPLYPKVSGTFTQSGTGDPSPSNIRPIEPWLASGGTVNIVQTDGATITLTAPQEIPAGWMDNEGKGQVTWVKKVFDGTEVISYETLISGQLPTKARVKWNFTYSTPYSGVASVIADIVSSHFIKRSADSLYLGNVGISATAGYASFTVELTTISATESDDQATRNAKFKAWLAAQYAAGTPVTVYYQLATPITLTPAPAPLTALPQLDRYTQRQNVVTTSAGVLEVTYAEHPEFDFDRSLDTAKSEKMMQYEHIPQMRFSGTMSGMTKEVPKVLRFEYRGAKNYINDSAGTGKRESGVVHTGYAEVKWQGTSSIAFPKKNFTVKLFEDEELTTKKKVALRATWGEQNKYCMKANFIDSTQCRNVVAAKVWGDMVRSRNTSSESYIRMHDLPNAGAVDGYPILVFLNDQYIGLYTMNIPKDEWMFGMEDGEGTNVVLCGESWGAPSMFNAPAVINGSDWGYEVEPADNSWVVNSFNSIYNALALPQGTEQEETAKRAALEAVVDIDSVIDYQILLDALCLTDNAGKNQLLVTYDGTKWIMSAYDLDTAFAMHWSGARYHRNDAGASPNNLTYTVKTLYPADYRARKTALKTGALSPNRILQTILNFAIDIPQEAYRAESELWPDQCGANTNAMQQIISFVMTRPDLNS